MKGEPMPEEKELRIDLPVKAFVPPGWVAQEALRLELYRRISLAARPRRASSGSAPRRSTGTARSRPRSRRCSRRLAARSRARALGVEEISTYREQVRHQAGGDRRARCGSTSTNACSGRRSTEAKRR